MKYQILWLTTSLGTTGWEEVTSATGCLAVFIASSSPISGLASINNIANVHTLESLTHSPYYNATNAGII